MLVCQRDRPGCGGGLRGELAARAGRPHLHVAASVLAVNGAAIDPASGERHLAPARHRAGEVTRAFIVTTNAH